MGGGNGTCNPAGELRRSIKVSKGVEPNTLLGIRRVEHHHILRASLHSEALFCRSSKIVIAFGIDNNHGFPACDRLRDQKIKGACFPRPGRPDDQGVSLGFAKRLEQGPMLSGQLVYPGGSSQASWAPAGKQFMGPLGMLGSPVKAIAEIVLIRLIHSQGLKTRA